MTTTHYSLIFIKTNNFVLLGYKKRGFGEKKWNGYGGKLNGNETIKEGAIRELFEESNLVVDKQNLKYLGTVTYNDNENTRLVYIFTASQVQGDLQETEEMKPQWFNFDNIPYQNMWPDSKLWVPMILRDYYIQANFTYNDCKLHDYNIKQLEMTPDVY